MKLTNSIAVMGLILLTGHFFGACDQPSDFPQFTRDRTLIYSIFYSTVDLFSSTLLERPGGSHNFDADCPLGGTVHIEGTTQLGITASVDVSYEMQDCRLSNSILSEGLILNGTLQHTANYDSAGFGSEDLFAENLRMEGSLYSGSDQANFKQECDLEASFVESEISGTILGVICGRDVGLSLWHVTYEEEEE